jgi:hypothetical protein
VGALVGSGGQDLAEALAADCADDLERLDDIDDQAPRARDALARLVAGKTQDGEVNFKYAYCFELLCRHLGDRLGNEHWSAMCSSWFDAVDAAFTGCVDAPSLVA